jgi:serine/threonine protein phosphatase PrpC
MIRTYSFSEAGGHPENEDAFVVRQLPGEAEGLLVCVADGQGGRAGGARAARLACDTVANFPELRALTRALTRADAAVAADEAAGLTTFAALVLEGDTVRGASCGDSAVLALSGLVDGKELSPRQFKDPPVGSGEAVFVPFEAELVRPWRVLAMTDGVWKYAGWSRVHELAAKLSGEKLLAALQAAARLPRTGQFQDDFTVVLVEAD